MQENVSVNWATAKHIDLTCYGQETKFYSKGIKGQLEGFKQGLVISNLSFLKYGCCMGNGLKERQILAISSKRIIWITKFPVTGMMEYLICEMRSTHRFLFLTLFKTLFSGGDLSLTMGAYLVISHEFPHSF